MAVLYGADAVYLAGADFGMRAFAGNFSPEGLTEAVSFAHAHGVRVHCTVNTMPRNEEMDRLPAHLERLEAAGVDAVILADLGVETATEAVERLREKVRREKQQDQESVRAALRQVLVDLLREDQPFGDVISPRLYEYLATGKPVVSMLWPDQVEQFPDVVYGAHELEEFVTLCAHALEEAPGLARRRMDRAAQTAWPVRVNEVERILTTAGLL